VDETIQFLLRHGYLFLFLFVIGEQIGLPLPALPVLMAAGALARKGQMSFAAIVAIAVAGSLLSDLVWYEIGRRRGGRVLEWMCRIALEPDSCVRRTENAFDRLGNRVLVVAKFVPGLNTAAPPMSGTLRTGLWRFLLYDTVGALLWVVAFAGLGYAFSHQLESAVAYIGGFGGTVVGLMLAALVAYIGLKFAQRRRVLRDLRVARIDAGELKRKLDSGEDLLVLDLRHGIEFAGNPRTIPGARHVPAERLEHEQHLIPRDREVVLFCT